MTLSGGQKQRLFIALALIHEPEVVFLDELTTGLDPQARRAIWELVTGIRDRGTTVFLTTHLMEEAERLCDRVAIIEHGRLIEVGTPDELVRKHCPERAVVFTSDDANVAERMQRLGAIERGEGSAATHTIRGEGDDFVTEVIHHHRARGHSRARLPHRDPDARGRVPQAHRPRDPGLTMRLGFLRGFWKLTWVETKIFMREPMGFVGTLVIPVVVFIVLGRVFGAAKPRAAPQLDIPFNPAILAAVLIALGAVQSLVAIMAIYREGGILKRLRATPLSPVTILGAHVVVKLVFTVCSLALLVLAGRRLFPGVMQVNVFSFTAGRAAQHAQHPLARLRDRQPRADRALRAADRRGRALPDARPVGLVLSARAGCRARCERSPTCFRRRTPSRCCRACGTDRAGARTGSTPRRCSRSSWRYSALSTRVFRWE